MDNTQLDHLNKAKARVDELKWFEAQLAKMDQSVQIHINGRALDCESVRLVLLANVRTELEQAQKYFASL